MIFCDPAWRYNNRRATRRDNPERLTRFGIGASERYLTESTRDMSTIPVGEIADERAYLFMWVTFPFLPDAFELMSAWGFKYCTCAFVWIKINASFWRMPVLTLRKVRSLVDEITETGRLQPFLDKLTVFGPGAYTASNVEIVLLARRAHETESGLVFNGKTFERTKARRQVIFAPRRYLPGSDKKHSVKPDEAQKRTERMYPPESGHVYVELFARRHLPGWYCLGNELDGLDLRESIPALARVDKSELDQGALLGDSVLTLEGTQRIGCTALTDAGTDQVRPLVDDPFDLDVGDEYNDLDLEYDTESEMVEQGRLF